MVKANVQFYDTLDGTEFDPREYRQTQINGRGVEGVEFVLEAKAVRWGATPWQRARNL